MYICDLFLDTWYKYSIALVLLRTNGKQMFLFHHGNSKTYLRSSRDAIS